MTSNNDNKSVDEALTQAVSKLSDILATAADGGGQRKYLDYEGLAELVSKLGQTYATLAALADYAKSSDIPTLSGLGGVGTVSASGTSPLTLSASKTGTTVAITGSVSNATANTAGVVRPYTVLSNAPSVNSASTTSGRYYGVSANSNNQLVVNVPWTDTTSSLSDLGGVGSVSASGTSPLTLSASKSGTSVSISGSVDLSAYAKSTDLSGLVASSEVATIKALTEAEYEALRTKESNVLYVITE